jgi:hypothetical protein
MSSSPIAAVCDVLDRHAVDTATELAVLLSILMLRLHGPAAARAGATAAMP